MLDGKLWRSAGGPAIQCRNAGQIARWGLGEQHHHLKRISSTQLLPTILKQTLQRASFVPLQSQLYHAEPVLRPDAATPQVSTHHCGTSLNRRHFRRLVLEMKGR